MAHNGAMSIITLDMGTALVQINDDPQSFQEKHGQIMPVQPLLCIKVIAVIVRVGETTLILVQEVGLQVARPEDQQSERKTQKQKEWMQNLISPETESLPKFTNSSQTLDHICYITSIC